MLLACYRLISPATRVTAKLLFPQAQKHATAEYVPPWLAAGVGRKMPVLGARMDHPAQETQRSQHRKVEAKSLRVVSHAGTRDAARKGGRFEHGPVRVTVASRLHRAVEKERQVGKEV